MQRERERRRMMIGSRVCILMSVLLPVALVGYEQTDEQQPSEAQERIFTIAVGHEWGAHEYMDDDGYLKGFNFDLITEVCSAAGMKCRTIWDKYENCWNSQAGQHSVGGIGLLNGYYDACVGWAATVSRLQVFDFSMPFLQRSKAYLYRKKGSNTSPLNFTGLTVGFQDGYMSDEECLTRKLQSSTAGLPLPGDKIKHFATPSVMYDALDNATVDLLFVIESAMDPARVEKAGYSGVQCADLGHAMMTRKDNDFNAYWNKGFERLLSNGRFYRLCKRANADHGHKGRAALCV